MKNKLRLLTCFLLICAIVPVNLTFADPSIDRDGDGIHIDDIVYYLSHTEPLPIPSEIGGLLAQIATIVPTPAPLPLFSDDFSGETDNWIVNSGAWEVVTGEYSQSSTSAEQAFSFAGSTSWTDYTLEADVKNVTSAWDAGLTFRVTDANNLYLLAIRSASYGGNKLEVYKRIGGSWTSLGISNPLISDNTFYHYKIVLSGNNIKVYFNNSTTASIDVIDTALTSGKIGLRTDSSQANFDNIVVSGTENTTPPPDTTLPVLTLIGETTVNLAYGASYLDLGATAIDDTDGDLTEMIAVTISNNVNADTTLNTSVAGNYTYHYNVSDEAGNHAIEITKTVEVAEETSTPNPESNIAIGAEASASSTYSGYSAAMINDRSRDTSVGGASSWTNEDVTPQWVQLDWGTNKAFSRVDLYTSFGYEIRDYQIQYWNGISWEVLFTAVTGNTLSYRTHTFTTVTGSKIRVVGNSGPAGQSEYVRVNELEVY